MIPVWLVSAPLLMMQQQRSDNLSMTNFLAIDEHALDKEWLHQPELYFEWAEKLAKARRSHDEAKAALDLAYAETAQDIRNNPRRYDLEKVTESAVAELVKQQKPYQDAATILADAKYKIDIYQAAVTALDHRKRALTMLVELYGLQYFANPKITKDADLRDKADLDAKRRLRNRTVGKKKEKDDDDDDSA